MPNVLSFVGFFDVRHIVVCPVVLVWSVDELRACEGQTRMSCDPVGCVALCFTSSREFRGAVELYG